MSKYDPEHLTKDDLDQIAARHLTVTVTSPYGMSYRGKVKQLDSDDVFEVEKIDRMSAVFLDEMLFSDLYLYYILYPVGTFHDDIPTPAIAFSKTTLETDVVHNFITAIDDANIDEHEGEEITADELKAKLVEQETPEDGTAMDASAKKAKKWEAKLPKANGFYKAATGSVWLLTGDVWTPILNHYGNVPPNALQQTTEAFAVSSGHSKRFPFERLCEKPLPTKPGWYKSADKTTLFHLDEFGVWRMTAYMAPTFSTLAGNGEWKTKYVPMQVDEIMPESKMRQYMPLIHYMLGLKQPKEEEYEENF